MCEPGAVVVCQPLDCRAHMLVLHADDQLRTALLADPAPESANRLHPGDRETVVRAVRRAEHIDTYRAMMSQSPLARPT